MLSGNSRSSNAKWIPFQFQLSKLVNEQIKNGNKRVNEEQKLQDSELATIELLKKKNEAILNGIDLSPEQIASLKAEIDANEELANSIRLVIEKKKEQANQERIVQENPVSDILHNF